MYREAKLAEILREICPNVTFPPRRSIDISHPNEEQTFSENSTIPLNTIKEPMIFGQFAPNLPNLAYHVVDFANLFEGPPNDFTFPKKDEKRMQSGRTINDDYYVQYFRDSNDLLFVVTTSLEEKYRYPNSNNFGSVNQNIVSENSEKFKVKVSLDLFFYFFLF